MEASRLDGELLLAKALDLRRIDLFMDPDRPLNAVELAVFKGLLLRRAAREPVAHLLGVREFWGLELLSSADALIPRPESELLVEAVLGCFSDRQQPVQIFEPCVGSGAVSCALMREYPAACGVGGDLSLAALAVAARNLQRIGCAGRMGLFAGDLDGCLASEVRFDVIVVNPPYIPRWEMADLQPEVRDWEPRLALDGGLDGLEILRRLPGLVQTRLRSEGVAAIEVGHDQGERVAGMFRSSGFAEVSILNDYHRIPRVVLIRNPVIP